MVAQSQQKKLKIRSVADALFLGMGCVELMLTGLTLHWQHSWSTSFQDLEKTRLLNDRFEKATVALEQYYLKRENNSAKLMKTSINNLIYLPNPRIVKDKELKALETRVKYFIKSITTCGIQEGY